MPQDITNDQPYDVNVGGPANSKYHNGTAADFAEPDSLNHASFDPQQVQRTGAPYEEGQDEDSDEGELQPSIPTGTRHHFVTIGVATSGRPLMLENCLRSLARQALPPGVHAQIVVVHNGDDEDRDASLVAFERFEETSEAIGGLPGVFYHIPTRGIALARNIILSKALGMKADWIAMIDDDEVADPLWLADLMAPQYRSIPVLMGTRRWIYPEPLPFWVLPEVEMAVENSSMKTAQTNNVRFSINLVKAGLRFNEQLGFMGGEDNEFFAEAYMRGFEIRRTLGGVVTETAHRERLTFLGQMTRCYWYGASNIRREFMQRGRAKVVLTKGSLAPFKFVLGLLEAAISPIFLFSIDGLVPFKHRLLSGCKRSMKALGRIAGMIGYLPEPYRHVVGR